MKAKTLKHARTLTRGFYWTVVGPMNVKLDRSLGWRVLSVLFGV